MPASTSGYSTFSNAVSTGSRLKFWKTKPSWRARKSDSASSLIVCTGLAADHDRALVGPVDAADQVEQRRLAAARRPGDDGEAVRQDDEVDVDQRRHVDGVEPVGLRDALQHDRVQDPAITPR